MKVIISGGGVGGLALAQGLRRTGHEVVVFERGSLPVGASGYRLRLDSRAVAALADLLPPAVHVALLASGPGRAVNRRLTYLDRRLRILGSGREDDSGVLMIGRGPLLRLLAHGLGDRVRWRSEVASYRVTRDDVAVELTDGTIERGDLVVGADGVRSPLRRQLLGDAGPRPLGIGAVSARVPGRPADLGLSRLADILGGGYALVSGSREIGVFLSAHDPEVGQAIDPDAVSTVDADREDPYLVWGMTGPENALPAADGGPAGLASGTTALMAGWHPELQRLPSLSDEASVQRYALNAAPPVPLWPTTAVTLLGDAIHAVPPTGGIGASTAIRDAGHLVATLPEPAEDDRAGLC